MNFKRISAIFLRQFYLIRDNPTRFTQLFVWMAIDIVLWGFLSKYLAEFPGVSAVALGLLGAVILYDVLQRAMQGVTTAFFEDVWSRNFLNLFASPLSNFEYIAGLVLASTATTVLVSTVLIVLAGILFGISFSLYGLYLLPFLLVLFLSGISLGLLGVAIVLRFGPSAEWFIWPIPGIVAPFVGVFYPISTLPVWMQWISRVLPPSYVFEGMRAVVSRGEFDSYTLLISGLLAGMYVLLAYWFFARVYRRAIRTGLIARYSAESAD